MPAVCRALPLLVALLLAAPAVQAHPLSGAEGNAAKCFIAFDDAIRTAARDSDAARVAALQRARNALPHDDLDRAGMAGIVEIQDAFAAAHLTDRDIAAIADECQRRYGV
ncbi:hypothetical protein [Azospirillum canadense]|uniref:hypothetical protein n=1 Tax=Azospirillum canadense TaxID=403962 RepID=UPI002226723E|nr:hypothetical protein [Azospirillum canadense]MCW2237478.1 hypothetical protein [Azospirillum canadense]